MKDEYIRKHDVLVALMDNDIDHIQAPSGKEAVQILSDIPAADVVPVIHGKWERHMSFGICDKGRYEYDWKATDARNFCPNCGAKMDGGDEHG